MIIHIIVWKVRISGGSRSYTHQFFLYKLAFAFNLTFCSTYLYVDYLFINITTVKISPRHSFRHDILWSLCRDSIKLNRSWIGTSNDKWSILSGLYDTYKGTDVRNIVMVDISNCFPCLVNSFYMNRCKWNIKTQSFKHVRIYFPFFFKYVVDFMISLKGFFKVLNYLVASFSRSDLIYTINNGCDKIW